MKYTFQELHCLVTKAYLKARREERNTPPQLTFEMDLEHNLKEITHELYCRTWSPRPLDWFINLKPVVREVFAPHFRDRVVSHVIFFMISPIFERYFIYDSHSCRLGKGTLEGISRFEHNIRSITDNYTQDAWCLNIDISGYFMSIPRDKLYEVTWKTLRKYQAKFPDAIDYSLADYIIRTYLDRDPLYKCVYHGNPALKKLVPPQKSLWNQPKGIGIPIGDVKNQLDSNIYMNVCDQFIKRELKIHNYNRYVDDAKCLHRDREYLVECKERIGNFLNEELSLTLHPNKTTITNLYDTTYFLGAAILPYRRYAKNDSLGRFKAYIESLENALILGEPLDYKKVVACLNSRLGYLQHFNEINMINKVISNSPNVQDVFSFTAEYKKAIIKEDTKYESIQIR